MLNSSSYNKAIGNEFKGINSLNYALRIDFKSSSIRGGIRGVQRTGDARGYP